MSLDARTIVIGVIAIVNLIVLISIKFNDLRHLEKDVSELKTDFKHYVKKLYSLAQRVAKIEGKLNGKS